MSLKIINKCLKFNKNILKIKNNKIQYIRIFSTKNDEKLKNNLNNWQEIYDKSTGLVSYYNPLTKEVKFDLSQDFKKGKLWKRFLAMIIDLGISMAGGMISSQIIYLEIGDIPLFSICTAFITIALFMSRDAYIEGGINFNIFKN